jgi:TorA maturation chaperone TorD
MTVAAPTSDLAAQAAGRARRAALLGRLVVAEPGPEELELARAVPPLAAAMTAGTMAEDYARVVLREVPAHESVFRAPDGQLGRVDPALLDSYRRWDFEWEGRWRVAAPDQLGVQLLCYAHLCAVEETGWSEDRPDRAAEAVQAQRHLLAAHLGDWGPVAADALRRAGAGTAYAVVAEAIGELLAAECERLRPAPEHPGMPPVADGLRLDTRPGGGPARIARRLLAPDRAGGYLLASDIAPLARALGTPWRPSDTRSGLRHVVGAALDDGRLDVVAEHLVPVVADWEARWAAARDAQPGAARVFAAWHLRAEATRVWLGQLDDRPSQPPVLRVPDADRLAQAVAGLSGGGLAVTVHPAPAEVLDTVDAVVRLEPGCAEGWDGSPPPGWDREPGG